MALVMCIAWPALAFMLVSQVPWLELSIQWTTPNVQGIQWMFGNNKGGTCATAARWDPHADFTSGPHTFTAP